MRPEVRALGCHKLNRNSTHILGAIFRHNLFTSTELTADGCSVSAVLPIDGYPRIEIDV